MSKTPKRWVQAMNRNNERKARDIDARVRRLCDEDEKLKAAMFELFEEVYETVGQYLCNFTEGVSERKTTPILEVIEELHQRMRADYTRLTGGEYISGINRERTAP